MSLWLTTGVLLLGCIPLCCCCCCWSGSSFLQCSPLLMKVLLPAHPHGRSLRN